MTKSFILEGIDPGSADDREAHRRLVCMIRGGGKLAIWGEDGDTRNIDKVRHIVSERGWPVAVRCEVKLPAQVARVEQEHTYWVRQRSVLDAVPAKK